MIGARQRSDIAIRKLDPWPRTEKSPSHVKTRGNLQFFLQSHRAEVNNENLFRGFQKCKTCIGSISIDDEFAFP